MLSLINHTHVYTVIIHLCVYTHSHNIRERDYLNARLAAAVGAGVTGSDRSPNSLDYNGLDDGGTNANANNSSSSHDTRQHGSDSASPLQHRQHGLIHGQVQPLGGIGGRSLNAQHSRNSAAAGKHNLVSFKSLSNVCVCI